MAALPLAGMASAQTTWTTTTAATTNWSAATWSAGVPTSGTSTAVTFFANPTLLPSGAITANNDLTPNPFVLNSLTVNGTGPNSGSSSLTISGNGIQFDGTSPTLTLNPVYGIGGGSTVSLNSPLTFNANTTINFGNGGGFINTGGAWNGSGNVTFSGAFANRPLSLTNATGTTFTGNLTLSGTTSVLQLNALSGALGANASTTQSVIVNSGSGVNLAFGNNAWTNAQNFVLNGNGNSSTASAAFNMTGIGSGNATVGGLALASDSTVRVDVYVAGESRGVSVTRGLVGSGKLTKTGPGYLFVPVVATPGTYPVTFPVTWGGTSYSAFSGDIDINGGVIQVGQVSNSFGSNASGTQKVTVSPGAAMVVAASNNSWTNPQNFVLNGSGTGIVLNAGGVNALQSTGVGFGSNVVRSIILASDASVGATRQGAAGNRGLSLPSTSAGLAGTGTLSISNNFGVNYGALFVDVASPSAGVTVTGGTTYAQFSGRVVINNGALEINNANSLGASAIANGQVYLSAQGVFASGISGGLNQAFLSRISNAATSAGTVALNVNSANNLDFTAAPNLFLGTLAGSTYSGTITPSANGYRLGGGGSTLTVSSALTGANALTVAGGVTLTSASNTFSGGITIAGINTGADYGTQLNFTGGTGVLPTNALTFSRNGGTFAYTGASAGSSQSMGTLAFSAGAGTVSSTYGTTGNTWLTFSSLSARTAGASGNFVISGGANGSTNKIVLTGLPTGFIDRGIFFGGSNYALNDASSFVRAPVYGTDSGFVTSGAVASLTSASHQQIGGAVSAQNSASFDTIRIAGAFNVTLASGQTLSVDGLLKAGANATTISGGTGIQSKTAGAELVIRSDASGDSVSISTPILDNGGSSLTKVGAGSLTLSSSTASTYAGGTIISQGTLAVSGGGLPDAGAVRVAGGTYSLAANDTIGALTLRNGAITYTVASNTAVTPWTLTGTSYAVENGQINVVLGGSGVALTKSTEGNVTLTAANTYTGNTVVQAGKLTVVNAVSTYPLGSDNVIVGDSSANSSATLDVLSVSRGFSLPTGKTLAGHGQVLGNVGFASGSTLSPGTSTGILAINGSITMASGSTFTAELSGTSSTPVAGVNNDQLVVNGTIDITGATLSLSSLGFAPTPAGGELLFIVRNDGADSVVGTFAGLTQGATVSAGGYDFLISYLGNAESGTPSFLGGNDIVLQAQPIPEPSMIASVGLLAAAFLRRPSLRA